MNLILTLLSYLGYSAPRSMVYADLETQMAARGDIKLRNVLNYQTGVGIVQRGMWFKWLGKKYYIAKTNGVVEVVGSFGPQEFLSANEAIAHNVTWFDMLHQFSTDIHPELVHLRGNRGSLKTILEVNGSKFLIMEWIKK